MAHTEGKLYLGTSGWMYKDWGELFYPEDIKKGEHLPFLASQFNTVEVNSSFYHLPRASTFEKWKNETPAEFLFSVKVSRFITHQKKIDRIRGPFELFLKRAKPMGKKLGVLLVQLPPFLQFSQPLFERFLNDVSTVMKRNYSVRIALEPRHKSWIEPANAQLVTSLPQKHDVPVTLVFADSEKIPSYAPTVGHLTSDFVYVRFHGPHAFAASRYGEALLNPWAKRIRAWQIKGIDVFAYFNNDIQGHAIFDARTLARLLAASA